MNDSQNYKVIIIGGGPSGIATSLVLTARGISNCIIEAKLKPIKKFGEAIPPNAKPLFKKLGIYDLLTDAKHVPYYGNKSCWGSDTLEYKEFFKGVYGHGYLLDRLFFEKQLHKHIKNNSGVLLTGYKLKKVSDLEEGVQVIVQNGNKTICLKANYIVDATGRKASVCRQLGMVKRTLDTQFTISIKASLFESTQQQIYIEATENGWWYIAPQGKKELNIMFFTLQEILPEKKFLEAFIKKELMESLYISSFAKIACIDYKNLKITPSGTSRLDIPYGKNWIAVGDAAISYDPISSFGVTSALASGFYAGHALVGSLSNDKSSMVTYRYILENSYSNYQKKLSAHYAMEKRWEQSLYWSKRFSISPKEEV